MTKHKPLILCIDDDSLLLDSMSVRFNQLLECELHLATSVAEALHKISALESELDLVITDMHFGNSDPTGGLRVVASLTELKSSISVIVLTGYGDVDNAVKSMEMGAYSYVEKATSNDTTMRLLGQKVRRALEKNELEKSVLESHKKNQELLERLSRDLNHASLFQRQLQFHGCHEIADWRVCGWSDMCDELGGDLSMARQGRPGECVVAVADIMGHGVKAALVSGMLWTCLDAAIRDDSSPQSVLERLWRGFTFPGPSLAPLIYVLLQVDGMVSFFSAGHPHPILVSRNGARRLDSTGIFLNSYGLAAPMPRIETTQIALGERLFIYSDGLTDARDADENDFGLEALEDLALRLHGRPVTEALKHIESQLRAHCGDCRFGDDITCLAIERVR